MRQAPNNRRVWRVRRGKGEARPSRSRGLVFLLFVVLAATFTAPAFAGNVSGDFNGDGVGDLAVGVPGEDVGSVLNAGAVNVIYGGVSGLAAAGDQLWTQASAGVADAPEAGDSFGSSLAGGDFDGDGFADLAIGVPREGIRSTARAGVVHVLYGSAGGLTATGSELWHQRRAGIRDASEAGDRFGSVLAAANLGRGSYDDLAIGIPGEDVGTVLNAGAVAVVYGTTRGLSATGDQLLHENVRGIVGRSERRDAFGATLAAADFGKGSQADLAIGVAGEDVGATVDAGAAHVVYGSSIGLSATGDQAWHQDVAGVAGASGRWDRFGLAIAAADFGKGPHADLAIGVPYDGRVDLGTVNVLYGGSRGISATGDASFSEGSKPDDLFGFALAAADFGHGGRADLAVGVPGADLTFDPENPDADTDEGSVIVLSGSALGLTTDGKQTWHQDVADVEDDAEAFDRFGSALAAADLGNGSRADLAVGVGREALGAVGHAGAVNVLYGSVTGLSAAGDQLWHQDVADVEDDAEENDLFGSVLALGR